MNDIAQNTQEAFERYEVNYPDEAAILALVEAGVDVNQIDDNVGTLLHNAAWHGHINVSALLVERGAKLDARTDLEYTPLHHAAWRGHINVCALLVGRGAKLDARDNDGDTPLHLAATDRYLEVCKWLLEHGADIEARNNEGETPLHHAARNERLEVCAELIRQGAYIHALDDDGNTPLHWANENDDGGKTLELLLARGANIWAQDEYNDTVLDLDFRSSFYSYCNEWIPKLEAVRGGDCREINTTQDLYYLASVMQPSNPHSVPPPKEFIRTLFIQYILHEPKFAHLYEAIFAETRPPEIDLQKARKTAIRNFLER